MRKHNGYTLIEMIVTVGIFSLAFVAIAAIFIGYTTAQSRAAVSQKLLNESNYVLEAITREIRMNAIDYACDGWIPSSDHSKICLRSFDEQMIRFDASNNEILVCKSYNSSDCIFGDPVGGWSTLKPSVVDTIAIAFYVSPVSDPRTALTSMSAAWQPMTTITMTVTAGRGRAQQTYDLQTAASSRVYAL